MWFPGIVVATEHDDAEEGSSPEKRARLCFGGVETVQPKKRISEMTVHNLPDEMLLEIFSYLDASNLPHVQSVCQRWYYISQNEELWRSIALHREGTPTEVFIRTLSIAPMLRLLDLRKELVFFDLKSVGEKRASEFAMIVKALEQSNCKVKQLVLPCILGYEEVFCALLCHLQPHLQRLTFSCGSCQRDSTADYSRIMNIIACMPLLIFLCLRGYHNLHPMKSLPTRLEELDLRMYRGPSGNDLVMASRASLKKVLSDHHRVTVQHLSECPALEEADICCDESLSGVKPFLSLKKMTLQCCRGRHDLVWRKTDFPALKHITVDCCSPAWITSVSAMDHLTSITLCLTVPWQVARRALQSTALENVGLPLIQFLPSFLDTDCDLRDVRDYAVRMKALHAIDCCPTCIDPQRRKQVLDYVSESLPHVCVIMEKCSNCSQCQHLRWWIMD